MYRGLHGGHGLAAARVSSGFETNPGETGFRQILPGSLWGSRTSPEAWRKVALFWFVPGNSRQHRGRFRAKRKRGTVLCGHVVALQPAAVLQAKCFVIVKIMEV